MELPMNKTTGFDARELSTGISDTPNNPTGISDSAKVRVGALSPAFPSVRRRPANESAASKVQMGALSPAFPALRTN
jgi:hypothetical protein